MKPSQNYPAVNQEPLASLPKKLTERSNPTDTPLGQTNNPNNVPSIFTGQIAD